MTRKRDEGAAAQAAALYSSGQTTREIAARLGVDPRTVARWVGDAVRARGPRPRTGAETDALIVELRDHPAVPAGKPVSFAEIGRRAGMSRTGVRMRYYALTGKRRPDRRRDLCDACERDLCELGPAAMPPGGCPHACHQRQAASA
jgi:transposase-like protein